MSRAAANQAAVQLPFEAVRVGVADDPAGPTGCTVVAFDRAMRIARDVRGGSACWSGDFTEVHALCLAGGSVYGLEALSGVAAELLKERGGRVHWSDLALVAGGAVYDFHARDTYTYPTLALGRAALRAASDGTVPIGRRGAGSCTLVGASLPGLEAEPGGQGAATRQVGPLSVAVLTVVNALGAVRDRDGTVVRGHLDPQTGLRRSAQELAEAVLAAPAGEPQLGNTTLTVLITNARLEDHALAQLGRQVHASMARVIDPFHTTLDGDILWAITTDDGPTQLDTTALGVLAAEVAWDAVLAAVR
jgi:6-aminohexanoate-oligomer endohydrolase